VTRAPLLPIVALGALALAFSGCGSSGASESEVAHLRARVAALDKRVSALQDETQRLKQGDALGARVAKVEARASTLAKNDDAFYDSVYELYFLNVCGGHSGCHIPLGVPGALYTDDRYPGRIFATSAP
jgi:hypothetical protein